MALTILPEIAGQQVNENISYCYLFEPLRVNVLEDTPATRLYIDILLLNLSTQEVIETLFQYVELDINPYESISFDLMEIAAQIHNSDIYKIGNFQNLLDSKNNMIVSEFIYQFNIYSSETLVPLIVKKLPILGCREYEQFVPEINFNQPINEFQLYNIDEHELAEKWGGYSFLETKLANVNETNLTPTILQIDYPTPQIPAAGVIYWKSRFGGWMFWGFEMLEKTYTNAYEGNLNVGMFNSTQRVNGNPYVGLDYTEVTSSYNLQLKAFELTTNELMAVAGISSSTVVYYAKTNDGKLEAMRLTSATVPLKNLADGGDFSISLQSISKTKQKTK